MGEGKEERILKEIVLQIGIEILLESGFPFMTSGVYMLRRCQQAKKKKGITNLVYYCSTGGFILSGYH